METAPKNYYFEEVSGCVYDTYKETQEQAVHAAADTLMTQLKKDGTEYTDSGDVLLSDKETIQALMLILDEALEGQHIVKYNKSNAK